VRFLVVAALGLGIAVEGLTFYRQSIGAMIDRQTLIKATYDAAIAKTEGDVRLAPVDGGGNMTQEQKRCVLRETEANRANCFK